MAVGDVVTSSQLDARQATWATWGGEAAMGSKVQKTIHNMHQLEVDNADLLRMFAELATLRERIRRHEAALAAKAASGEMSTTSGRQRCRHHYPSTR